MDGIKLFYRDRDGRRGELRVNRPQYIFMEPYDQVVIRYYYQKNGIETDETNITRQVLDPNFLEVKVRSTSDKFISRIADFDSIEMEPIDTFPIDFKGQEEIYVDVLYRSLTTRRLKIKVSTFQEESESFENEYTVSDGADEFVKITDVQIKYDAVYFNYIYRRSGRLKKFVGQAPYEVLGTIYKSRKTNPMHVDRALSTQYIDEAFFKNGWLVNELDGSMTKMESGRKIDLSEQELADLIKEYARPVEILNLLRTNDLSQSNHPIRRIAEDFLQDCDKVCGLPDATIHNTLDHRT